jgi:hypothetical protein
VFITPLLHQFPKSSFPKVRRDLGELIQRRLQVFGDLCGDDIRVGQVCRILQAFVFQPEDVETDFVALEQFFVAERLETF